MFFGADVGETLMRAVSQALIELSDGISGQEGSTRGVLMSVHLGQKITFTQFEKPFKWGQELVLGIDARLETLGPKSQKKSTQVW